MNQLQPIEIPDSIQKQRPSAVAARLIEIAHDRIESFMLEADSVTENFVRCDFALLEQSLAWIDDNHLLTGRRFCELGSGFGVAAMLAALRGMEAVGVEIESNLVQQANELADEFGIATEFFCGSFVPRDMSGILELGSEVEHVETHEGDVYDEMGLELDDFDLFFAFPWPGEEYFFEAVFAEGAAVNSLLLTYRGRDGMHLLRKT